MRRSPADGLVRRYDDRGAADGGVELDGAGGERKLLHGRLFRRAFLEPGHGPAGYYGKLTFITFFNAGVRVLDIRDPDQPKEVGYFIPPEAP